MALGELKSRGMDYEFGFKTELGWTVLIVFTLALLLANLLALAYYKLTVNDGIEPAKMKAALTAGIPIGAYLFCWLISYFAMPTVSRSLRLVTMQMNNLSFSEKNTLFTSSKDIYQVTYSADFGAWDCFLLPLILLGSLTFSVAGGIGLSFLPMDFFRAWKHQPKKPQLLDHVLAQRALVQKSLELIAKVKALKNDSNEIRFEIFADDGKKETVIRRFLKEKQLVKIEFARFAESSEAWLENDNIDQVDSYVYDLFFFISIVFSVISVVFVVHLSMVLVNDYTFLETIFFTLDNQSAALATVCFQLLAFYITFAMFYGVHKLTIFWSHFFGSAVMRLHESWLVTIVLNFGLGLLGTIGFVTMIIRYLPEYTHGLDITKITRLMLANLQMLRDPNRFKAFSYGFALFFLFGIYLQLYYISPREFVENRVWEKKNEILKEKERLEALEKIFPPMNFEEL